MHAGVCILRKTVCYIGSGGERTRGVTQESRLPHMLKIEEGMKECVLCMRVNVFHGELGVILFQGESGRE